MHQIKNILFTCFLTLFFCNAEAQVNYVKEYLNQKIGMTFPTKGLVYFYELPEEKQSCIYSILISVNKKGNITDIKYRGRSEISDGFIDFNKLTKLLKEDDKSVFKKFKNSFLVAPVWIKKVGWGVIKTTPEFINSMEELIPNDMYLQSTQRKLVLPITIVQIYDPQYR